MRKKTKILTLFLLAAMLAASFPLSTVLAFEFNKNYIISDFEFTDANAFSSAAGVQYFLERKGSGLADYSVLTSDGVIKKASDIIWEASQENNISPKFLLTLLQKESGLVTEKSLSQSRLDWTMGAGVCDGCSKSDPEIIKKYKGFDKQITWAAELNRWYLDEIDEKGKTITGWGPGITKKTLDGLDVTPVNAATAALYTYNPWVGKYGGGDPDWGANSLLWKKWTEWFTRVYPDGTLLREKGEAGVWLLQSGKLRPFLSKGALISRYDTDKIIDVTKTELDRYEVGDPIKFANYSFLRSPRGTVYLLVDDIKRGFASREALRQIGVHPAEIMDVEWEDLNLYGEGEPITEKSVYPTGNLLQNNKTGGVYFVQNGIKQPLWSKEILNANFKNKSIVAVAPEELEKYDNGTPVKFSDGELITAAGDPAVYVISNGTKRPIASAEVFEGLGYKWNNIIETTGKALSAHPTGEPVELIPAETDVEIASSNK